MQGAAGERSQCKQHELSKQNLAPECSQATQTFKDSSSRATRALSASLCARSAVSFLALSVPVAASNSCKACSVSQAKPQKQGLVL